MRQDEDEAREVACGATASAMGNPKERRGLTQECVCRHPDECNLPALPPHHDFLNTVLKPEDGPDLAHEPAKVLRRNRNRERVARGK
jgi:hypothetical protein